MNRAVVIVSFFRKLSIVFLFLIFPIFISNVHALGIDDDLWPSLNELQNGGALFNTQGVFKQGGFNAILLTEAYRFSSDNVIFEDVYEQVKSEDDLWATFQDGEFLKVVFEKELDSLKVINVVARSVNIENNGRLEIYTADGGDLLGEIKDIGSLGDYRVTLSVLASPRKDFLIKILGDIEIDLIIDPYTWSSFVLPGTPYVDYFATSLDGKKLVATSGSGYLNTSTDYGQNWIQHTELGFRNWRSVTVNHSGSYMFAADYNGLIYRSTNSGVNWTQVNNTGISGNQAIFTDRLGDKLLVCVNNRAMYCLFSRNAGLTWTANESYVWSYYIDNNSYIDYDYNNIYAPSNGWYILRYPILSSSNLQTPYNEAGSRFWKDITVSRDGKYLAAVVQNGYIFVSSDYGASWQQKGIQADWRSISSSIDGKRLMANIYGGLVYLSEDYGATWSQDTNIVAKNWLGLKSSVNLAKNYGIEYSITTYHTVVSVDTPPLIVLDTVQGNQIAGNVIAEVTNVKKVQYQQGSNLGDWSDCTAADGTFDSSYEGYLCEVTVPEVEGRYNYYLRAINSGDYATALGNEVIIEVIVDNSAPTVEFTEIPADPSSNPYPTYKGVITDQWSNISSMVYQLDSTLGTWNNCSAVDGSLNSISEGFACISAYPVNEGNHVMYFKGTDASGNELSLSEDFVFEQVENELQYFEINTDPSSNSYPEYFQDVNGIVMFEMDDQFHGEELWRSNGTIEGTYMVKDIYPGDNSSSLDLDYSTILDGVLFFEADDGVHGYELWRSDGTEEGTYMVKDIRTGDSSYPDSLQTVGNQILFEADDGVNGEELWRSDGTVGGTYMVKDIYSGSEGGYIDLEYSAVLNGVIYFEAANNGPNGYELWRSDGTEAGTYMLKDIYPGGSDSNFDDPQTAGNLIFFEADDGVHGTELWRTDGTAGGTLMVKDTIPGSDGGYLDLYDSAVLNGVIYFENYDTVHDYELWRSDGTEVGTYMLKDIYPGASGGYAENIKTIGNKILFEADDGVHGEELWCSDGTVGGTYMVKDIYEGINSSSLALDYSTVLGEVLYFPAENALYGSELWRSDGTELGTYMIKDIYSGVSGAYPDDLKAAGSFVFFEAEDGINGYELWRSDGTEAGTVELYNSVVSPNSSNPEYFINVNGIAYFVAEDATHGPELWRSNGTEAGTFMVKDTYWSTDAYIDLSYSVSIGDVLFFVQYDEDHYTELWRSDGTAGGTFMLKDINLTSDSYPRYFKVVNDYFLFVANDGVHGEELWRSDGTVDGTYMVKDTIPGVNGGFLWLDYSTVLNDVLYFTASDGVHGFELWRSDGTEAGTYMLKDIDPGGDSYPDDYYTLEDIILFEADDGVNGYELWRSDGTVEGTYMLKDIYTGFNFSYPEYFKSLGEFVLFEADDGVHGDEIWRSDGTVEGTYLVKDIWPGADTSFINLEYAAILNGVVYFQAEDGVHGRELWRSDGTEAGTFMVKNINLGSDSSPDHLISTGKLVYFEADDGVYGTELWRTDGTGAGTYMVLDWTPGIIGSNIDLTYAVVSDGVLFFQVGDTLRGSELAFITPDLTIPDLSFTNAPEEIVDDPTPVFNGEASDSLGAIARVEYQIDGIVGEWSDCTAADGVFNEKVESFICDISVPLEPGEHMIYLRVTDQWGNRTAPGNELGHRFTLSSTNPPITATPTPTAIPSSTPTPTPTLTAKSGVGTRFEVSIEFEVSMDNENNLINIDWSSNLPVKGYIEYGIEQDGNSNFENTTGIETDFLSGERSVVITGLEPDKDYIFRIVAQDEDGNEYIVSGVFDTKGFKFNGFINFQGYKFEGESLLITYRILKDIPCMVKYGLNSKVYDLEASSTGEGLSRQTRIAYEQGNHIYFMISCDDSGDVYSYESDMLINVDLPDTGEEIIPDRSGFIESASNFVKSTEGQISLLILILAPFFLLLFSPHYLMFLFHYGVLLLMKNKNRRWGLIYDAETKKPIAYALVRVFDINGKQAGFSVSDNFGKYRLNLAPETYTYEVTHADYVKQSKTLKINSTIEMHEDFGLRKNRSNFRMNINWMVLSKSLVIVGFMYSVLCLLLNQVIYNWLIVIAYSILFIIQYIGSKRLEGGEVIDIRTNKGIGGVFVRIYSKTEGRQLETSISSNAGKVIFNVKDGVYRISIYKQGFKVMGTKEVGELMDMHIKNGLLQESITLLPA